MEIPSDSLTSNNRKLFYILAALLFGGLLVVGALLFRYKDPTNNQGKPGERVIREGVIEREPAPVSRTLLDLPRGTALVTTGTIQGVSKDFVMIRVDEDNQKEGIPPLVMGLISTDTKVLLGKMDIRGTYHYYPATIETLQVGDVGWFTRDINDDEIDRFRLVQIKILGK